MFAFNSRGLAWWYLKEYDKAMKDYDEAIRQDPKFAAGYYNRAKVHAAEGRTEKALSELERCAELGFRDFKLMGQERSLDTVRKEERYATLVKKYSK